MAIKSKRFGLSCAISTPMFANGAVNHAALAKHAGWVLANGCDSVTLFGTTGEGAALTMHERDRMLGAVLGTGLQPEKQLLAGVCAPALGDAVEQAAMAYAAGCRGILLMPPFYFKGIDDDGLFAWHAGFIERLKGAAKGIIVYHIPSQSNTPISVALVDRLKKAFPGVITGVKDSSGDWDTQAAFLKAHGELSVLVGDERLLARSVREGGEGSICGVSNVVPGWLRPLVYEGKDDARVNALVEAICSMPVMSGVKALAGRMHGMKDDFFGMRAPLPALTGDQYARLVAAYDALASGKAG